MDSKARDMIGQVRSILHSRVLGTQKREALWHVMVESYEHDPTRYAQEWVPYLASFPHHFVQPLVTLTSLEELWQVAGAAPSACLALVLHDSTEEERRALAHSPHSKALCSLDLSDNSVEDECVEAIVKSPHFQSLRSLTLAYNDVDDEGLEAIAHSPYMSALTSLDLTQNYIGHEGILALTHSPHVRSLAALSLAGSDELGDKEAHLIAHSSCMRSLTSLDLSDNQLGDDCAKVLAQSSCLQSLTSLVLEENEIGVEGARAIAQFSHLRSLTSLDLGANEIGAQGAMTLASSPHLAWPGSQ